MALFIVRHAHAGSRHAWSGDDGQRPLSDRGWKQAEHLRRLLADLAVGRFVSSPAVRCVQTVEPAAVERGLQIETDRHFAEGADVDRALHRMLDLADGNPVVSSHGDLIPKLLRKLHAAGMRSDAANISQKGSLWVIEVERGRPVAGTYHPPG